MGVSTKKGDGGYTRLLSGERVSKSDLVIEAEGALDETSSFLGLARASAKDKRVKRILLQVQKHLFQIGAELATRNKSDSQWSGQGLGETEINWIERLVDDFEETLALPPRFIAFGQEEISSHMDVARTAIRKLERIVVRMKEEGMIREGPVLKYLNRLSDLIFLLACFEEKDETERRKLRQTYWFPARFDPAAQRWIIASGIAILILAVTIILLLMFHGQSSKKVDTIMMEHMRTMEKNP